MTTIEDELIETLKMLQVSSLSDRQLLTILLVVKLLIERALKEIK